VSDREVSERTATADELAAVMNVLDGALLATDAADVEERVRSGCVLVAVDAGAIIGACVLDDGETPHVEAIAVRPGRRDGGVGRTILETGLDRYGRLTAAFDERVLGFYESLGFEIEPEGDHYRGVLRR